MNIQKNCKTIIAIGRNYAEHAKGNWKIHPIQTKCFLEVFFKRQFELNNTELGNAVPEKPFFFLKPRSSLVTMPNAIEIPAGLENIHHEGKHIDRQ